MPRAFQVAEPQVLNRRADIEAVLVDLDNLCASILQLRLSFACVGLLLEWVDSGVDPLAVEVVQMRVRLTHLYDGLDFSLIEEWLDV